MKYIAYKGMEKQEISCDSVGIILDDGTEIELYYRHSDKEVSLSIIRGGQMVIEPRASNTVRIGVPRNDRR